MPLLHDQIDDFVTATLDEEVRRNWVDISLEFQEYMFAERMVKSQGSKERSMANIKGPKLKWRLQFQNLGSYRHSELYAKETPVVDDIFVAASVEWTKQTVNFSYDLDEDEFQGGYEELVNLIDGRKHSMWNDYYEGAEKDMWTAPTSSSQNPRVPYGIPFWIQKPASTGNFDFNGGNPSGFSDGAAGVDVATYDNWKNGTATYTTVSEDDLFDNLSKAMDFCNFKSPDDFSELGKGPPDWSLYTVYSVIQQCQKLLKSQNDNVGTDLGKYRNTVLFRGVPLYWVRALDNSTSSALDSTNPIYGINWKHFYFHYRGNKKPKVTKPKESQHQPTVRTVYGICWGQWCCTNRRSQFVINDQS